MKILFTGASSFTGFWFVNELIKSGHQVYTTYTKSDANEYEGIRKERIEKLSKLSEQIFSCEFGSSKFCELINSENNWDVLCHHAADVTNYKSLEFDFVNALKKNTSNISKVMESLLNKDCRNIILTGSVFEEGEGEGSDNLKAFSPYGLSKGLTFNVFKYYSQLHKIKLGKFIIPNPFGPYEDPRFTTYLMKTWFKNEAASVNTPEYVRDNIHVNLLAKVYNYFLVQLMGSNNELLKINPSGYAETQGEFAKRFAAEMRKRTNLACGLELKSQTEFPEPKVRINNENTSSLIKDWNEEIAWNELADYYKNVF